MQQVQKRCTDRLAPQAWDHIDVTANQAWEKVYFPASWAKFPTSRADFPPV